MVALTSREMRSSWNSTSHASLGFAFTKETFCSFAATAMQPKIAEELQLDSENPVRRQFLARLDSELASRGVIEVLRHGIKHGKHDTILFYSSPSADNEKAQVLFRENRFSVTR